MPLSESKASFLLALTLTYSCWTSHIILFISPVLTTVYVHPDRTTSVQFSSVSQWCPPLCDPIHCSTPGFPAHHQLLELAQTHVHRVSDAIQPSYPLSSPSPPAFNLSQHQGLFQWLSSSHQVAKVLELQHHIKTLRTPFIFVPFCSLVWNTESFF